MIHVAGPFEDWVQRCSHCNIVLCDYRDAAWPEDQDPPSGFREGEFVQVEKVQYMTSMQVVEGPRDCERILS